MCPVLTAPSSLGAVGHRRAVVPPPAQTLRSALPAAFSSLIWGDNELWRHTFFGLPRLSRDQTEKLSGRGGFTPSSFCRDAAGCSPGPAAPFQYHPWPCRCQELPARLDTKAPRTGGCSSAWGSCFPRGRATACSGALGDQTGGFLTRAEAVPPDGSARGSDPALPAHVTRMRGQEDLRVEMPHSTVCCLSAFEIGGSGSGRGGRPQRPAPLTCSSFLASRGIASAPLASVASGAALFSYMLIFSCFIILALTRYQKPSTGSGNASSSQQLGRIWPGRALPPLPGGGQDLGFGDGHPLLLPALKGSGLALPHEHWCVNRDFP